MDAFCIYLFTDDSVRRSRMIKAWVMRLSFQAKTGGEIDSNNNLKKVKILPCGCGYTASLWEHSTSND